MKLSEFQNISMQEVMTKTTQEIKELVQWGVKVLNPRINRLYRGGAESGKIAPDALEFIEQTGGLFTTASDRPGQIEKTRNELISELKREIRFSGMKTSTVTGARKVKKERERIVRETQDTTGMSQEEIDDLLREKWESFKRFRERHPNVPSDTLLNIYITSNGNPREMENQIEQWKNEEEENWRKAYEEAERQTQYRPKWTF